MRSLDLAHKVRFCYSAMLLCYFVNKHTIRVLSAPLNSQGQGTEGDSKGQGSNYYGAIRT